MSNSHSVGTALRECLSLAGHVTQHDEANQVFETVQATLKKDNPEAAEVMSLLWNEVLSAHRSAAFWEQLCNVERELTERMAANHFQLQQNYLRLMQEQ